MDPATSYLRAARSGNLEKVLHLLEGSGVDVNTANAVSINSFQDKHLCIKIFSIFIYWIKHRMDSMHSI